MLPFAWATNILLLLLIAFIVFGAIGCFMRRRKRMVHQAVMRTSSRLTRAYSDTYPRAVIDDISSASTPASRRIAERERERERSREERESLTSRESNESQDNEQQPDTPEQLAELALAKSIQRARATQFQTAECEGDEEPARAAMSWLVENEEVHPARAVSSSAGGPKRTHPARMLETQMNLEAAGAGLRI